MGSLLSPAVKPDALAVTIWFLSQGEDLLQPQAGLASWAINLSQALCQHPWQTPTELKQTTTQPLDNQPDPNLLGSKITMASVQAPAPHNQIPTQLHPNPSWSSSRPDLLNQHIPTHNPNTPLILPSPVSAQLPQSPLTLSPTQNPLIPVSAQPNPELKGSREMRVRVAVG